MSVRKQIPYKSGIFFITFTNARWLPLFEITNGYDAVYQFFDYLKSKNHFINAYVIMPEHVHVIITFTHTEKSINRILGDGKRFMTYALVSKLKEQNQHKLLDQLSLFVNATDLAKGKRHEVFEPSFDWKYCESDDFIEQKLIYIHLNPCRYKIPLALNPSDYLHSSAGYYLENRVGIYEVEHLGKMKDINFENEI